MTRTQKRWMRVGAWLLLVGALFYFFILPWLIYLPPNGKAVLSVRSAGGVVALTIDDGPDPDYTEDILDVLGDPNGDGQGDDAVTATFFMTGDHIRDYPEVAKKVKDLGHKIGNHGRNHESLALKPRAEIEESIRYCDEMIKEVLGLPPPRFIRVANGEAFLRVGSVVRKQDRVLVAASAVGDDWLKKNQENHKEIVRLVMKDVKPGCIIALHDGCAEDGLDHDKVREDGVTAKRDGTVRALREILDQILDQSKEPKNLRVVTIEGLVGETDPDVLTEKPLFWLALAVVLAGAAFSLRWCWRVPDPGRNQSGEQAEDTNQPPMCS